MVRSSQVLAALAAGAVAADAFVPMGASVRGAGKAMDRAEVARPEETQSSSRATTTASLAAMGCAGLMIAGGAATTRRSRHANVIKCQAEGEFAGGLNGGQSAFSSM
eukprot:CAMPEP_0178401888 /NCGR_PEP_ID=MMETSP0689_2-20121128/16543_1 /TAXON_ID=160604 /ORGANISM="Amphidinium massartii, Strain CS-259" /LENGTH=106 /DNA_ID=CAMNT_0020022741 /DNA_START=64 /DNA_END=381 /DNA_ORIENTATION=+